MDKKQVIADLLKNGAKKVENLIVRNVNVTPQENYVRLAFTLNEEVPAYVEDEEGTRELKSSNVIFASLYAIAATLKDNDTAAFAANHILTHPEAISVILSRAKITIIQESVTEGQMYSNPFSSDAEETAIEKDNIFNHVVNIELSKFGEAMLMKMAEKMMGF